MEVPLYEQFLWIIQYFISLVILLGPGSSNKCQVIDVLDSSSSCADLGNYPIQNDVGAGGVIGGRPLFCGGRTGMVEQSSCYAYNKNLGSWDLFANMAVPRRSSAGAVVNGKLWVTGGYKQTTGSYQVSTEFIFQDGTTSAGPDLPEARLRHCMVTLEDGKVMILGTEGLTDGKSTEIFDPYTNTFTAGPDMLFRRGALGVHFCLH